MKMNCSNWIRNGNVVELETNMTEPECLQRNYNGYLPIQIAAQCRKWEIVCLLARKCPEALLEQSSIRRPVLHEMILENARTERILEIIKLCPMACTQSSDVLFDGQCALHLALSVQAAPGVIMALMDAAPQVAQYIEKKNGQLPIHLCCRFKKSFTWIKRLIEIYPNGLAITDYDGQVPLHIAIENRCGENVVSFLVQRSDEATLMMKDDLGFMPIHLAGIANAWHWMQILGVACRKCIGEADPVGDLPIHVMLANQAWKPAMVLLAIDNSCASIVDRCGRYPLHVAMENVSSWNPKLVQALIHANPDAAQVQDVFDNFPLHRAMEFQNWEIVEMLLLKYPAATYAKNKNGYHALYLAARYGCPANLVERMIEEQPTHTMKLAPQMECESPLHVALRYQHWETALALVQWLPQDAAKKNIDKLFPVQLASINDAPPELIQKLANAFPNVAAQIDRNGNTMVYAAVMARKWPLVQSLVHASPHVTNMPSSLGESLYKTALHQFAPAYILVDMINAMPVLEKDFICPILEKYRLPQEKVDSILQSANGVLRYVDDKGNSLLHLSIMYENILWTSRLLHHGANVFHFNDNMTDPISMAKLCKVKEIQSIMSLNSLLQSKTWINVTDTEGQTPLFHAIARGDMHYIKLLLDHGANPKISDNYDRYPADLLSRKNQLSDIHYDLASSSGKSVILKNRYLMARQTPLSIDIPGVSVRRCIDLTNGEYVSLFIFNSLDAGMCAKKHFHRIQQESNAVFAQLVDCFQFSLDTQDVYIIVEEGGTSQIQDDEEISQDEALRLSKTMLHALSALYDAGLYVHPRLHCTSVIRVSSSMFKVGCIALCFPSTKVVANDLPKLASNDNVWSVGAAIYRAFTGSELNMPKDNSNAQVDISERISEEPLIPHKLKLLLLQMLQVEPAERINATAIMDHEFWTSDFSHDLSNNDVRVVPFSSISVAEIVVLAMKKQKESIKGLLCEQNQHNRKMLDMPSKVSNQVESPTDLDAFSAKDENIKSKSNHLEYVGQRVRKIFEDGLPYDGTVKSLRTQNEKTVWFVVYDDGDEEEVERAEIENILMATQKSKQHIRGHFVTSKDQLNLHDKVWIAFENEVFARGTVVDLNSEFCNEEISIRVQKISQAKKEYCAKFNVKQNMAKHGFIRWKARHCFVETTKI